MTEKKPFLRKLPKLTPENKAFWQGGKDGHLLIYACKTCQRFFHPPQPICPNCQSENVIAEPVSGRGTVVSYTINQQAWVPELDIPFVIAIVELEEQKGLRFVSNIVNCAADDVFIGMAVTVTFENVEDIWLPLFKRA